MKPDLSAMDTVLTTPEIEELEEIRCGGIADLGDPRAAEIIQLVPGYQVYRQSLEDAVRRAFGNKFTMYRSATLDEASDIKNGTGWGPKSFTFDRSLAHAWKKLAAHSQEDPENPHVVYSAEIEPDMIVIRGRREELELVVNTSDINGYFVKIIG